MKNLFQLSEDMYFALDLATDKEQRTLYKILSNISSYMLVLCEKSSQAVSDIIGMISSRMSLHYSLVISPLPLVTEVNANMQS